MTSPQRSASTRVGEDDRENAVRRVREAYAEQRITHEEMDDRLDRVLAATTYGDLTVALGALPAEDPGATATISVAGGRISRRGVWQVPRTLKVESAYGRVHLDLSRAVIAYPVVDIELRLGVGNAGVTVPRDAIVEVEGLTTGWKDLRYQPRQPSRPDVPRIRISGEMGYGRLKIRHAWR
ncbi:hypothetical protein TK78_22970 [Streptomyces sp. Tue 6075]|uniref:DUF1707 SHOCT-like domain-containing protein n=1 Tax=Streptomyces sp. Tue 6075 TaxID=1661694 RepID=UPI00094A5ED5|nr:DUF1707 domain-containing protein [Streptomyces sp. Tue 6075]APS21457.1 hypothetical protein TK78_22970 [Streptomyces sp. Tue 6075]